MLKLGDPVSGFIESSSEKKNSAQLTGWDTCSADEWLKLSENTFPPEFNVEKDAIYKLPQLAATNFGSFYPPNVPYLFARSPSAPKYFQTDEARTAYNERVNPSFFHSHFPYYLLFSFTVEIFLTMKLIAKLTNPRQLLRSHPQLLTRAVPPVAVENVSTAATIAIRAIAFLALRPATAAAAIGTEGD